MNNGFFFHLRIREKACKSLSKNNDNENTIVKKKTFPKRFRREKPVKFEVIKKKGNSTPVRELSIFEFFQKKEFLFITNSVKKVFVAF